MPTLSAVSALLSCCSFTLYITYSCTLQINDDDDDDDDDDDGGTVTACVAVVKAAVRR